MKPTIFSMGRVATGIAVTFFAIALISWDHQPVHNRYAQSIADTTPKKSRDKKMRDLDDVLEELDKAEWVDTEKMRQELNEALKSLNFEKIQKQLAAEMKNIDTEKIMKEVKDALAAVDFSRINKEIAEAFSDGALEKQIKESINKVEWEKIAEQVEKVKEIDMKKMKEEMEKAKVHLQEIGPKLKEHMDKAKLEIEKAKEEIREYKGFIEKLHDAGLLDKNGTYSLKHKDGVLTINGREVSAEVYRSHSEFLKKHSKFNIEKSSDDLDLDLD